MTDRYVWTTARKKPVEIQYRGPYVVAPSELHEQWTDDVIETIEGEFEIDDEYLAEHDGYVIIKGVDGELYPCAWDIFKQTYEYDDNHSI